MKQLTETKLRGIIREELSRLAEAGGGYAIYEIEPGSMNRLENGEHPSQFGSKIREGGQSVLRNWANRQGWTLTPRTKISQDIFVERSLDGEKFYVIDTNQ